MKELSVEEKAKHYDEAYKKVAIRFGSNVADEIFPELKESEDEGMVKFIKKQLFNIKKTITENYELDAKLTNAIDWLEKQGEHANFRNKIQIGDKVTRNEDGVLVNLSQLKRVAKHSDDIDTEKQGKNNMGISEATKKKLEDNLNEALEKETPESWNKFLDEQGEQKPVISNDAIREGIAHFGITQYQIDNWLKKYVDVEKQGEQKQWDSVKPVSEEDKLYLMPDEQKPTEEYNITGIGSKNAQGKLGEMIKNLKPVNDVLEQKPTDKVKPKFKVGDIVKHKNNPHLTYILKRFTDDGDYEFHAIGKDGNEGCTHFAAVKCQDEWKLVEQKPVNKVEPKFHEGDMIIHKELGGDYIHNPHKIIQVDILDKKYRLEGGLVAHFREQDDYELVEQKTSWSKEDENMIEAIDALCDDKIRFTEFKDVKEYAYKIKNWLKSIKERYTWKPSDEQMERLKVTINSLPHQEVLFSLYQDLKKLREEQL